MKRPSTLSESLHQRLNSYALAASAAGVGVLALAQPAEARIIYTPKHVVLEKGSHCRIDLDRVDGFVLSNNWVCSQYGSGNGTICWFWLKEAPANQNATGGSVVGQFTGIGGHNGYLASALRPEKLIGKDLPFHAERERDVEVFSLSGRKTRPALTSSHLEV